MNVDSQSPSSDSARTVPLWVQIGTYSTLLALFVWQEVLVWLDEATRAERLNGWLSGTDADWLPFIPFVFLFPIGYWGWQRIRRPDRFTWLKKRLGESPVGEYRSLAVAWGAALSVFLIALLMSMRTGERFSNLPPAYHDEYSYLIQAETFAAGRWFYPGFAAEPDLFDQMHVLNEGKFASRYFPGTGLWMTPFVLWGMPWLGHQVAQALSAMMVFWCGRELSNTGTGWLAGLLYGLSPGLILFSNLLLGHHPTLVGLTFFLWAFLKFMRTTSLWNAFLAGCGLAFAMLCRPMTAAGFGLPFGVVFVVWWLSGRLMRNDQPIPTRLSVRSRSLRVIAMGIPLLCGFILIAFQNLSITGDFLKTPYGIYNEIYTPRHVYGFNNVIRGERADGPLVSDGYDRWTKNLTPELAWQNVVTRFQNSWRWTLGAVPLIAAFLIVILTPLSGDRRWPLIWLAILSLHIAHIPYWFSGIMGWHYVFETAPLWLLLLAEATRRLRTQWFESQRPMLFPVWILMLLTSVVVNHVTLTPLWPSRLERGVLELRYPRDLYAQFRSQVDQIRGDNPAIVFVVPDLDDVSMDYVTNPPDLQGPVLVARVENKAKALQAMELFPDRVPVLFDAKSRRFNLLKP